MVVCKNVRAGHAQRGQVFPMWVAGVLTTFTLMFLALNYGNAIRWQIRAQNAADSAAHGMISIQAQRWNEMTATLYAANVEEYRVRRLLDSMMLTIDESGGCNPGPPYDLTQEGYCNRTYVDLRSNYLRANQRYGSDVELLNDIAALNTYATWQTDSQAFLTHIAAGSTCNPSDASQAPITGTVAASPTGGDCAFKYTVNLASKRTGLSSVGEDADSFILPGLGHIDNVKGNDSENNALFAPVQVDVVACVTVPPIIPAFGPIKFAPYKAIGRAAAADVMVEEDWLQPGSVLDPQRGPNHFFQEPENVTNAATDANNSTKYDWYNINFGGNNATAYSSYGIFYQPLNNAELDVRVGWWGAVPIRPFGNAVDTTKAC